MEDSFFDSLDRLEYVAFFAGYPLVYTCIQYLSGRLSNKQNTKIKITDLLPFGYALVGTLYVGLQLRNLFPDYSIEHIKSNFQHPVLKCWAFLSLLCWIPAIARIRAISLFHSFIFMTLWLKDILFQQFFNTIPDVLIIRNEMKIYTDSLLLNFGTYSIVFLGFTIFRRYRHSPPK